MGTRINLSTATLNATEPPTLFGLGRATNAGADKHGAFFHIDTECVSQRLGDVWPPPVTAATMPRVD
jgi:hypothetical protein